MPLPTEKERLAWKCAVCGRPAKDHVNLTATMIGEPGKYPDHKFRPKR